MSSAAATVLMPLQELVCPARDAWTDWRIGGAWTAVHGLAVLTARYIVGRHDYGGQRGAWLVVPPGATRAWHLAWAAHGRGAV